MKTKRIEIDGKTYTLTARRSLIKTISEIAPEMLEITPENSPELETNQAKSLGVSVFANLDILFYDMIKVAHPNIDKAKSDDILDKFEEEYDEVQENLIDFAMSVFQSGDQSKKKKINW